MQEYLAFLLPVAAASGWWAATKHNSRRGVDCSDNPLNKAYFRGLNYLLDEKPDKAIDVFVDILKPDCEVFETHIALGSLYRRRGEVERAIDIHTKLSEKTTLTPPQRALTMLELATDFMLAGLFGRSKELFGKLLDDPFYKEKSLQSLLSIVQQEKDWPSAISYVRELAKLDAVKKGESVAQFYCEMAEESIKNGQDDEVLRYLEQARVNDHACVRATLMKAQYLIGKGEYRSALSALKKVERQNSKFIPETIEPITECYMQLGEDQDNIEYLLGLYKRFQLESAARVISKRIRANEGSIEAIRFFSEAIQMSPSAKGLHHLIVLFNSNDSVACSVELPLLEDLSFKLAKQSVSYQCSHCGFTCTELHWCCPGCHYWETIKPVEESITTKKSKYMVGLI